jgi:NADH-quinone oxidoreductase subunit F
MTEGYVIDSSKCISCGSCAENCPVSAISGSADKPYSINQEICIKCGKCKEICPVEAIDLK